MRQLGDHEWVLRLDHSAGLQRQITDTVARGDSDPQQLPVFMIVKNVLRQPVMADPELRERHSGYTPVSRVGLNTSVVVLRA